jgi:hypothetical protein
MVYGYGVSAVEESYGADGYAAEQVDTIAKRLMSNEGKVRGSLSTPHSSRERGLTVADRSAT